MLALERGVLGWAVGILLKGLYAKAEMKWAIVIFAIAGECGAIAQGTFQNLDFESANIPSSSSVNTPLAVSDGLPGWSAYYISGTTQLPQPQVFYDGSSMAGPRISVVDANVPDPALEPLQGNYSAVLFGGLFSDSSLVSVGISQTGFVPIGTRSILVDAYAPDGSFVVTLGGQTIDMVPLESFVHYSLWGGNIPSSIAGQTETLSFVEPASSTIVPTTLELDDISFSPTVVTPEPDAAVLMGIGGALFAVYRRFVPRRK